MPVTAVTTGDGRSRHPFWPSVAMVVAMVGAMLEEPAPSLRKQFGQKEVQYLYRITCNQNTPPGTHPCHVHPKKKGTGTNQPSRKSEQAVYIAVRTQSCGVRVAQVLALRFGNAL